jgi:hypothetical protein
MTPPSERDAVLRERAAAARMRCAVLHELNHEEADETPCAVCVSRVITLYPLPQIERPRVVTDGVHEYTWRNGLVQHRSASAFGWWEFTGTITDRNRSALLDLLANPTELIDDDGVQP